VFILNNDCWCSSSLSWILRCGTQVDSLKKQGCTQIVIIFLRNVISPLGYRLQYTDLWFYSYRHSAASKFPWHTGRK
jgi:hypothetical protein